MSTVFAYSSLFRTITVYNNAVYVVKSGDQDYHIVFAMVTLLWALAIHRVPCA